MDPLERKMKETSSSENVSTKLQRIAELAGKAPEMVMTNLAHHIDFDLMAEARRRVRRDAAPGVDGETAEDFDRDLEANLNRLVIVCREPEDAKRVMEVLPKRLGKYGLQLHPDKTRTVDFRRPPHGGGRGNTFDLLGFTHYWAKSRKGKWVVKHKTAKDRFSRALKSIKVWCKRNRHKSVPEQHKSLSRKLRGHYNYYGITGNSEALGDFLYQVKKIWRNWLDRRSQRRKMNWDKFNMLLKRYKLPPAICVHSTLSRAANP